MSTKKLLVPYDESKPTAGQDDFLAVVFEGTTPVFYGLRSSRIFKTGRVVFVGKEITEKELFAKLIDSGRKVTNVKESVATLANYVRQIVEFRIGDVVTIKEGSSSFELVGAGRVSISQPKNLP